MASSPLHHRPTGHSLLRHRFSPARRASLPPAYDADNSPCLELKPLALTASASSADTLPEYEPVGAAHESSSAGLAATHVFQIETRGHALFALPLPPKPVPVPVYAVLPTGEPGPLAYQSLRATRSSGTSSLVRAGAATPVCTTTYRFGLHRPPHMRLHGDAADVAVEVRSVGCHTRAQTMRTPLGTLQWRYARRAERKAVAASSLLVLELVTAVDVARGRRAERRTRVAQLVRSDALRTPGTRGCTAGNGGRLMMDLTPWADAKGAMQQMEVLVVASCITMLKKEVDRRRIQQLIVMSGAAGGGP